MRNSIFVLCIPFFMLLSLSVLAEEQEIKKIGIKELDDLLAANRGKVVVLNFWASFSPYCRNAVPFLNELRESYKEQGFEILGISAETDLREVEDFVKRREVKYPVFMAKTELLSMYKVTYIPHYIFIDRQGNNRYEQVGLYEMIMPEFEMRIKNLLSETE